uniref:Peptidase M41 domain-containing protein n=1 Tax=Salix viminalis TaxID=40686 RepID=A0A6N2MCD0_SALVM
MFLIRLCCDREGLIGFTGADLQNLMNEAAIVAARRDLKEISKDEISDALERIIAGPEKKNAVVSEEKKKLVAYHEAGHALVGALMPEYDPVAKISIIPRGQAGVNSCGPLLVFLGPTSFGYY